MNMLIKYRWVILLASMVLFMRGALGDSVVLSLIGFGLALSVLALSEEHAARARRMVRRYEETFFECEVSHFILSVLREQADFPHFVLKTINEELGKLSLERARYDSLKKHEERENAEAIRKLELGLFWREKRIQKLRDSLVNHLGYKLSDDPDELALQVRVWLSG